MMAGMELEHGANAAVIAMARMMKDGQLAEIAEMKPSRQQIAGSSDIPEMGDAHMEADMQGMESLLVPSSTAISSRRCCRIMRELWWSRTAQKLSKTRPKKSVHFKEALADL